MYMINLCELVKWPCLDKFVMCDKIYVTSGSLT